MSKKALIIKRVKDYRKYDPSMKREIARRYLAGEFSYRVAAEEYGLPGKETVKEFVKWYRKELERDQAAIADSISSESQLSPPDLANISRAELEKELIEARKLAHLAKAKEEAWRVMVKHASEYVGEDIVKKFGPGSSKK